MFNHLLDQLKFFECFYMLLNHILRADQKRFFHQSNYRSLLFLQSEENITSNLFDVHHSQMIKQKGYLLPENLDQLRGLNIGLVPLMFRSD